MSYSVYLKISGKKYKLPVNPEEIKKTQKLSIEKYQVLKSGQVSVPKFPELWTYEFSCELPHQEVHYMESGSRADRIDISEPSRSPRRKRSRCN
ncbi:MAG: hypothetical protein ACLR8P_01480 [Clostridium fessum]